MKYDKYIPANLGTSFLKVRTNSSVGSGEKVVLRYYDKEGNYAAGFGILFSTSGRMEYALNNCQAQYTNFTTSVPAEQRKEWIIEKWGYRTKVYCNRKQVLDITASSEICDHPKVADNWDTYWGRDVSKLEFPSEHDTAPDSFCIGW